MTKRASSLQSLPRFVVILSLLGGAGAVILIPAYSGSITPGGIDWNVTARGSSTSVLGLVFPLIFFVGALFELVCALAATVVLVLCSRFMSRLGSSAVAVFAATAAAGLAALISDFAARLSAVPVELIFGSYVFFNRVVVTLLVRLGQEKRLRLQRRLNGSSEVLRAGS
jgi:hypothetical protein